MSKTRSHHQFYSMSKKTSMWSLPWWDINRLTQGYHLHQIQHVSQEICDTCYKYFLVRSIASTTYAMRLCQILSVAPRNSFANFCPELELARDIPGGPHHSETLYEHLHGTLVALFNLGLYTAPSLASAALFHDIGKVHAYKDGPDGATFHNHEVLGARLIRKHAKRWFANQDAALSDPEGQQNWLEYVVTLIREHMFFFEEGTKKKTIHKWLMRIGRRTFQDLIRLRIADRAANRAKVGRPLVTRAMLQLLTTAFELEQTQHVVYHEQVAMPRPAIQAMIHGSSKVTLDTIYNSLVSILNRHPEKNTYAWITQYIEKVYL